MSRPARTMAALALLSLLRATFASASIVDRHAAVEGAAPFAFALPEAMTGASFGGLHLAFGDATLYPLVADGKVVGLYVEGGTSLRFRPDDPYEAEQLAINAKRVTRLRIEEGTVVGELREEVGDETFFTILKSYLTNHEFEHIRTERFIALTSFITKRDFDAWFEQRLLAVR